MIFFSIYYVIIIILGRVLQYSISSTFSFSIDIFLILLIFYSLNFVFNIGFFTSIIYGIIMDYYTGLPLGFFVFSYTLIFYLIEKLKLVIPKSLFSATIFFSLAKVIIWFLALIFADFIDLKSFNYYNIFNLDIIVNIIFLNFLYPIFNYFTKNFYSLREDY